MYLEFYRLKENPFNLVSDPRFLYYSESHCDAMAHLLYGVRERKGIILMLGEAGTGKTTLVRATLDMLQKTRVVPSLILNPIISTTEEFYDSVLRGFGLDGYRKSILDMSDVLQRFLMQQTRRGRIPVLIVDEGQELSKPLLEQVRMLSNLEADGQKMLQIVLSAQPEMSDRLDSFELRAMRQRITVRCRLSSLTAEETWSYLNFRLLAAGGDGHVIFLPEAVERMYAYSSGIPRILNSIADNCLLAGYARSLNSVDARVVERVAEHLELQEGTANQAQTESIHQDVLRASSSWSEVVQDIRKGAVPPALKQFVEKLQAPEEPVRAGKLMSAAVQRGE
jgi:general secretion pathway protein A